MDDQRVGSALRAIRMRKRWRQTDLATRAKVSPTMVVRIEHGRLASIPLGMVRRVAHALDARLDTIVRWQGGDLGRLINARHAAMHEAMARSFAKFEGWHAEPEVSFSIYGERGIIDILAWHSTSRAVLVVELKTELVDINDLMGSVDQNGGWLQSYPGNAAGTKRRSRRGLCSRTDGRIAGNWPGTSVCSGRSFPKTAGSFVAGCAAPVPSSTRSVSCHQRTT